MPDTTLLFTMQNPGRTILGPPGEFITFDAPNQGSDFDPAGHSHELQSGLFKTCFVFFTKAEIHKVSSVPCFSNSNVYTNTLGILLKCSRSVLKPEVLNFYQTLGNEDAVGQRIQQWMLVSSLIFLGKTMTLPH